MFLKINRVRDGVHTHFATLIGMVPEVGGWVFFCTDKAWQLVIIYPPLYRKLSSNARGTYLLVRSSTNYDLRNDLCTCTTLYLIYFVDTQIKYQMTVQWICGTLIWMVKSVSQRHWVWNCRTVGWFLLTKIYINI